MYCILGKIKRTEKCTRSCFKQQRGGHSSGDSISPSVSLQYLMQLHIHKILETSIIHK